MKMNLFQKRLIFYSICLITILIISWSFAFKKTLTDYTKLQEIKSGINKIELAQNTLVHLKEQLDGIQLTHQNTSDSSSVKLIFKNISDLSARYDGVKIVSFPEIHKHSFKRYDIETLNIILEGNYFNLVKFVHNLEQENNIGRIVSAGFELKQDIRKKKEFLQLEIYIQNTQKLQQDEAARAM